tara:strand:- start:421 stop:1302 length:882 start_codon:yes stop_codon:yes gene_type:complete
MIMEKTLSGKVAIITGANRGLGYEIAKKYVSYGAKVVLFAREKELLESCKNYLSNLSKSDENVLTVAGDVSIEDDVIHLFDATLSKFGSYDILVNNAGIYGPKGKIEDIDWKEWRRAIEVNLYGSVLTCREAIPYFKKQNSGKIIQLSGGGATNPLPGISSYAVSKAGIVRFIETLSEEVKGTKIDINAIAPGPLNTRMLDEIIEAGPNKVGADFYQKSLEQKDTGGTDLSYACDLALFLGSNLSDGITGKLISAVWDNWEEWPSHIGELSNSDVYTLRRIAGRDREIKWGDK